MQFRSSCVLFLSLFFLLGGGWLFFGYFGLQALFTNTIVNEDVSALFPSEETFVITSSTEVVQPSLLKGLFQQGDSTYSIQGTASMMSHGDEATLILSDFSVTNGPDLYVYLVSASTTENGVVKAAIKHGSFVEVARLKGNRGNQAYVLPKDVVVDDSWIVTIWCKRFSRHFGSAKLGL